MLVQIYQLPRLCITPSEKHGQMVACMLVGLDYPKSILCGTRSSAIAEGARDASCQLKSCQLPRNSAETTYTTSPDQIDGMKLEI